MSETIVESQETSKLYAALIAAQAQAPEALGKVDRNDFSKFDYVSADRMIIAGRAALQSADLALLPLTQELHAPMSDAAATLRTTYRLIHSSGEWLDIPHEVAVFVKKGTPIDKATYGAITECLGYAYRSLLSIGRLDKNEVHEIPGRDDRDYEPLETPSAPTNGSTAQLAGEFISSINEASSKEMLNSILEGVRKVELGDEMHRVRESFNRRWAQLDKAA